ncbi:metal-dependent transcriptional regulator [Candidatus Woesearchaeota archaeon]|nr:metal-dependent transcriptional regulator [Candidatus Woesearchaeota archaeon]
MSQITATREDYLRAMFHLEEEYHRPIKSVEVASYLKLAKSTVSERIRELARHKLIKEKKYASLEFTKRGRVLAKKLTYKHRIIEAFLYKILKMDKKQIHEEAHRLEHAFSDDAIARLNTFLGRPKTDPHGQNIPV